jgi:hypothetical protein
MGQNGAGGGVAQRSGRTIKGRRGQFVSTGKLTDRERDFVRALVANGGKMREAADEAGYQYKHNAQAARELMARPHVAQAVREERARVFDGELANAAVATIRELMTDPFSPAGVRLQAARLVFERTGEIGPERRQPDDPRDRPLAELTIEQLQSIVSEGKEMLNARVIPGEVIRERGAPHDAKPDQPALPDSLTKSEAQKLDDFLS